MVAYTHTFLTTLETDVGVGEGGDLARVEEREAGGRRGGPRGEEGSLGHLALLCSDTEHGRPPSPCMRSVCERTHPGIPGA